MKKSMIGIVIIFVLLVFVFGCIDNTGKYGTEIYGTEIYKGEWRFDAAHFGGVKQEIIDAFDGNYVAYKNGTTIILIGTGRQMSVENDIDHQLKRVFTQVGEDVNTTYYLDGRLGGYSYTKQTTTDQMFDISKKTWEGRSTTAEENLSDELHGRTENVKL
ncbi:MAG: hypothetical protein BME94_05555 [Methanobacteriales archaeon Met13]